MPVDKLAVRDLVQDVLDAVDAEGLDEGPPIQHVAFREGDGEPVQPGQVAAG